MSTIATSDTANLALIQSLITRNRTAYNTISEKISSGSNFLMRSDDPTATNQAALISIDQAQQTQFAGNVSYVSNWETATYSYLDDISEQFFSAFSLATEANNTINEVSGWASIAEELDSVVDSILADGNSKYLGTSLFAGTRTNANQDTFTIDSSSGFDTLVYNGSLTSDSDAYRSVKTATSASSSSDYGTIGDALFGHVEITEASTDTTNSKSRDDFNSVQAIIDLRDYVSCGGDLTDSQLATYQSRYGLYDNVTGTMDTPDKSTILNRIMNVIEAGSTQISNSLAKNSASSNKFTSLSTTITSTANTDQDLYSSIVNIDTAKAATDLSSVKVVLQASMTLAGNINQLSLINFI